MYVDLHPDAEREFTEHAIFYERQESGLGLRFIDEIDRGIEILVSQPRIGPIFEEDFRYFVLDIFPFSLIYRIESERIWIIAVAHQSRHPGYWLDRQTGSKLRK